MKNVYEMNKKELKDISKEFNKTAYGKKWLDLKTGGLFSVILAIFMYGIIYITNDSSGFDKLLHEGFLWGMCLIGSILEVICYSKYNHALKEYIDYKIKK